MIECGPATADDMVLAFLRAEIESPRFSQLYRQYMGQRALSVEALLHKADLSDGEANGARADMLKAIRGYGANQFMFAGFPDDVRWRRVELENGALGNVLYARCEPWITLSGPSRRVADGAASVRSDTADPATANQVAAVVQRLAKGERFAELIAIEVAGRGLMLMEGHTRATAYAVAKAPDLVPVLLGTAMSFDDWHWR